MEAIAAVSFACNVLQLIDYAIDTSKVINDIKKHGGTSDNERLSKLSKKLDAGAEQVEQYTVTSTSMFQDGSVNDIQTIAQDIRSINKTLQEELDKLQRSDLGLRSTLKTVVKTVVKHRSLQGIAKQLHELRQVLSIRIETDLWQRFGNYVADQQVKELVDSLRFPEINERINQIQIVAEESFDWIFANTDSSESNEDKEEWNGDTGVTEKGKKYDTDNSTTYITRPSISSTLESRREDARSHFQSWLRQDSREIFWINGKAGSGKSTLMKKIWNHQETSKLLELQHEPHKSCILRYSFWLSGSPRQRSLKGFLCSLLHQLLIYYPVLAHSMLQKNRHVVWKRSFDDWSTEELNECLLASMKSAEVLKICIFVDGLDECHPKQEQRELCIVLDHLVLEGLAKVCASSRPEPLWIGHFRQVPQLRLQDLNSPDIRRYVAERLGRVLHSTAEDSQTYSREDIIGQVVWRAEGVFLWAQTVTQLLLRGIGSMATRTEIWNRLTQMPSEMGDLYEDMLFRLGTDRGFTDAEMALYLKMCLVGQGFYSNATIARAANLRLKLAGGLEGHPNLYSLEDFEKRCEDVRHRISSICTGFLDIVEPPSHTTKLLISLGALPACDIKQDLLYNIQFSHRSVRDFLVDTIAGQAILKRCPLNDENILDTYVQTALLWWHLFSPFPNSDQGRYLIDMLRGLCIDLPGTDAHGLHTSNDAFIQRLYIIGSFFFISGAQLPKLSTYQQMAQQTLSAHPLALLLASVQGRFFQDHEKAVRSNPTHGVPLAYDCLGFVAYSGKLGSVAGMWDLITSTPEISHRYASYLLLCLMYRYVSKPYDLHVHKFLQAGANSYMTFSPPWKGRDSVSAASSLLFNIVNGLQGVEHYRSLLPFFREQHLESDNIPYRLILFGRSLEISRNGSSDGRLEILRRSDLDGSGVLRQKQGFWIMINLSEHLVNILQRAGPDLSLLQAFVSTFRTYMGDKVVLYAHNGHAVVPSASLGRDFLDSLINDVDGGLPYIKSSSTVWETADAELHSAAAERVDPEEHFRKLGFIKDPSDPSVLNKPIPPFDPMPETQKELDALVLRLSERFRAIEASKRAGTYDSTAPKPRIWFPRKSSRTEVAQEVTNEEDVSALERRSTEFFDAQETQT